MTPDEVKEAAKYVEDNQDVLIQHMFDNELAEQLLHAYIKFDAAQHDADAQSELVRAVEAYKEGRGNA